MRIERKENGELQFSAGQFLTTAQIISLIARLAAQPKDNGESSDTMEMLSVLGEVYFLIYNVAAKVSSSFILFLRFRWSSSKRVLLLVKLLPK